MNTRLLFNLLLGCVAVALVLVTVYRPGLDETDHSEPLTQRDASSIQRIVVTRQQRDPIIFSKSDNVWHMDNDQQLPASEFQLRALLGILSSRPGRSYPQTSLDLATAGLQPPQATLQLDDILFNIGNTAPLDIHRYIQYNDTVHLVRDTYQHLINAQWTNFVDRHPLPPNSKLQAIQSADLQLHLDEQQHWQTAEGSAEVDATALQAFADRWQAADATYLRAFDGDVTDDVISLTLDDGEIIELFIIKRKPELVLARPDWGIQYYFPGDMSSSLLSVSVAQTDTGIDTGMSP